MYRPKLQELAVIFLILLVVVVAIVQFSNTLVRVDSTLVNIQPRSAKEHGSQHPNIQNIGHLECNSCESCVNALLEANRIANAMGINVYVTLTRDIGRQNGSCIKVSGLRVPYKRWIVFDGNGHFIYATHFNPNSSPAIEINSSTGVSLEDINVQVWDYAGWASSIHLDGVSRVVLHNLVVGFHGYGGSAIRIENSYDVTLHEVAVPTDPTGSGVVLYNSDSCRLDGVSIAYLDKQMTKNGEDFWADAAAPLVISFSDGIMLKRIRILRPTLGPAIYANFSNVTLVVDSYSYICSNAESPLIELGSSSINCECYSGTIYWHSSDDFIPFYCPCDERVEFNACKEEVEEWVQWP
ncbi:MAG: hypothetical protein PWP76_128 [Candidatus Diapherotrites archaeon]|nr:hypothetical protein [Candidatus Diapherotrites archaeon]MDN5366974.1 hypothetical protein [Candidatus Diapherotrites archaeon]